MQALMLLTTLALGAAFEAPSAAAARKENGMVVSKLNRTLMVLDTDQKTTHKYEVPTDTTITLDGRMAKLDDLQPGDMVDVSLTADNRVVSVEGRSGKLKDGFPPGTSSIAAIPAALFQRAAGMRR